MDNNLTLAVKELAYRLGADLVGIANIERFENAPIKMSPKGILPTAKSVIVCNPSGKTTSVRREQLEKVESPIAVTPAPTITLRSLLQLEKA